MGLKTLPAFDGNFREWIKATRCQNIFNTEVDIGSYMKTLGENYKPVFIRYKNLFLDIIIKIKDFHTIFGPKFS